MAGSIVTRPGRAGRRRLLAFLLVVAMPLAIVAAVVFAVLGRGAIPSVADVQGPPVRATTPAGERVMLLTSQWHTFRSPGRTNRTSYTRLYVDVWGFDGRTGQPVWRRRISDDRAGVNMGRTLLGVHGGVLWLLDGQQLLGLDPATGAVTADAAAFEAANPALRGVVPAEARYIRFDPKGLSFTAADGSDWRLTGNGAQTAPDGPRLDLDAQRAEPEAGVFLPARVAGGNGTWAFYSRGLRVGDRWLGLLAEPEVEGFQKAGGIGGVDPKRYPRTRVWSARVGSRNTFFGPRPTFGDFAPLPEGPEFLTAGLLEDGRCCHRPPILVRDPDSVLVLHRDRLGEGSRLRLTRVTGPGGKPAWTADLPVESLEAVMPGETTLVLLGARNEPPLVRRRGWRPESVDHLVTIDLATGRQSVYGLRVAPTPGERIPASSTPSPPAPAASAQ